MERNRPALLLRCRAFARLRRLFLLLTDHVAAGKIKIVSGLSGRGKFLKMLGRNTRQRTMNKEKNARES